MARARRSRCTPQVPRAEEAGRHLHPNRGSCCLLPNIRSIRELGLATPSLPRVDLDTQLAGQGFFVCSFVFCFFFLRSLQLAFCSTASGRSVPPSPLQPPLTCCSCPLPAAPGRRGEPRFVPRPHAGGSAAPPGPAAASCRLVQRRGTPRPPCAAAREEQREAGRVPLHVLPAVPKENEREMQVSSKRQCF